MRKYILLSFFSFLFFLSSTLIAQDGFTVVTSDLESWNTLNLKYKANKKFNMQLTQGLRLNHNASIVDQVYTNLGFKWSPVKQVSFGLGTRYIYDRGGNSLFDNDFRINLDFSYKHKYKALSFQYRLRYQNRNEIGLSRDDGDYFKNYLRLKAEVEYNIKKWKFDPVFSTEIFRDMTKYSGGFDNLRFTLGTNYSLKKWGELNVYYRLEHELGSNYPKTTNIIGLGYTYTIKHKKND